MVESNPSSDAVLPFIVSDVFTTEPYGGNPLAIVLGGGQLSTEQMQRMAGEFNLSETVFVLEPVDAANDQRLRIFTPKVELPFAGHPTVGTALALAERTADDATAVALEEDAGLIRVTIDRSGEHPTATLTAAQPLQHRIEAERAEAAALLGLGPEQVVGEAVEASVGTPFLFVELVDRAALGAAAFDLAAWAEQGSLAIRGHVFCYTFDGAPDGSELWGRMYAPAFGIPEDPATGSAASTLGALLALRHADSGTYSWLLHQGIEMGRPSELFLSADLVDGVVTAARVGGSAVVIAHGTISPPR